MRFAVAFFVSTALLASVAVAQSAAQELPQPRKASPLIDETKWLQCVGMECPTISVEEVRRIQASDLTNLIEAQPKNPLLFNLRGLKWMQDADDEDTKGGSKTKIALKEFTASLRLNPRQPMVYVLRGIANYWLEEYQDAIDDFDCALRFEKKYACAYYYRARSYFQTDRYDEAIDDYLRTLRAAPSNLDVGDLIEDAEWWRAKYRGQAAPQAPPAAGKDAVKFRADLKKCLESLYMDRRYDGVEQLTKEIQTQPSASLFRDRGLQWMLDGLTGTLNTSNLQIAVKDFNASLRLCPRQPEVYILRGIAEYDLARVFAGVENVERQAIRPLLSQLGLMLVIPIEDGNSQIEDLASQLSSLVARAAEDGKKKTEFFQDANEDFWCALRFEKKYACAYLYRGKSYFGLQSYDDAIDDYLRALRRDPASAKELDKLIAEAEGKRKMQKNKTPAAEEDEEGGEETTEFVSFQEAGAAQPEAGADKAAKTLTIKGDIKVTVTFADKKPEVKVDPPKPASNTQTVTVRVIVNGKLVAEVTKEAKDEKKEPKDDKKDGAANGNKQIVDVNVTVGSKTTDTPPEASSKCMCVWIGVAAAVALAILVIVVCCMIRPAAPPATPTPPPATPTPPPATVPP